MATDKEKIPNENNVKSWDEIFHFQSRKIGGNYSLLKEFLKEYFETPKLKFK